ncbi:MAG: GNAT family N-acetyltransferase [Bdellovibrio sp.]|nr:GNAT family N-acetyltransferase [Bdellovibrio sp.]
MSTDIIQVLPDKSNRLDLCNQIETIFFQTSSVQHFPSEQARMIFKDRWLTPYLSAATTEFYSLWVAMEESRIVGYLTGHSNTLRFRADHEHISLSLFADLHDDFPAHLHINMAPHQQGKGVGASLIQAYLKELQSKKIGGVHLVTGPKARNTSFYRRQGFSTECIRTSGSVDLLFMGQKLD